jgi:hypothetical protein
MIGCSETYTVPVVLIGLAAACCGVNVAVIRSARKMRAEADRLRARDR